MSLLILFFSLAQSLPVSLTTPELTQQLDTAKTSILLSVPTVRSFEVSEALRRAAVERKVAVYLLVDPALVEAPDSYVPALETYDTLEVRLTAVQHSFVVIDNALVIEGALLSENAVAFDAAETVVLRDPDTTQLREQWFAAQWSEAVRYVSFVEHLKLEVSNEETLDFVNPLEAR